MSKSTLIHRFSGGLLMALLIPTAALTSEARFASVFNENMVLQRDQVIRVWGTAEPGAELSVSFADHAATAVTSEDGSWSAEIPPLGAGGPYVLELRSQGAPVQQLANVLVGEVWLCSGQSNMAYRMRQMNDHQRETSNPPPNIRLLTVERDHGTRPRSDFKALAGWSVADTDTLLPFSAACYLYALELQKGLGVPFGLINASWGGSAIEAWISARGLRALGGFDRNLELVTLYGESPRQANLEFASDWQAWWTASGEETTPWATDFDDRSWPEAPDNLGDWRQWEDNKTQGFTGMVWYRKSFRLTAAQAAGGATLHLGSIDEVDIAWVNGRAVGSSFGWGSPRTYTFDAGALKAGINVLAVNVYNSWGAGGLVGPPESMRLELEDGSEVALGEGWRYFVVPTEFGTPPRAPWESITGLTTLHNAMIAPLAGFGLGGVMWYQGESNTGRPPSYAALLSALIRDWRGFLGEALPFIVVQLPNFGQLREGPSDSGWAQLRHDQQRAALADPLTGLVVTLDSADRTDLHPPNKRIIGQRAAAVARSLLLGGDGPVNGIVPQSAAREGDSVVVTFLPAGLPLRVVGSASPAGFELCDAAASCRYAEARLENDRVVIDAGQMSAAMEVRHAWADAPLVNLYSAEGLPVSSFRLEIGSR
jgi:sialate O-acetylesterase